MIQGSTWKRQINDCQKSYFELGNIGYFEVGSSYPIFQFKKS